MFRKCLITAAAVIAEVKSQNDEKNCRPSELPIYSLKLETSSPTNSKIDEPIGKIESAVREVRQTVTKSLNELSAYKRVGVEHFDRSVENLDWLIDYLRKEDNTLPKAGAIGIGGLTGLIFGLRGGIFKRTLYTATGVLGMGAVCYPKEAAEYSKIGLAESKKYLTVAYNFAYGVKKDDPPLELPSLPKIPLSISELWDSVKSSTSSLLSDKQEQVAETVQKVEKVKSPKKYDPVQVLDPKSFS